MKSKLKKISLVFVSLTMILSLFDFFSSINVNNIPTVSVVKAKSRRYKRKGMSKSGLRKLHHYYVYAGNKRIVGNRNSKIYHVPGQAGYRINVANAVYFKSEQQAIRAGYRRSRR